MRNILLYAAAIMGVLLTACDESLTITETITERTSIGTKTFPKTWKEQIAFAQKHCDEISKSSINNISLEGYTHKGKIKTEKQKAEILKRLFNNETYVVKYPGEPIFEIVTLGELRKEAQRAGKKEPKHSLMKQLEDTIQIGMDIIELQWKYNGKIINSTAIASNDKCEGILYDHIGNMITIPNTSSGNTIEEINNAIKNPKTRTGEGGMTERYFEINPTGEFYTFGKYNWECYIRCSSFFDTNNGILIGRSTTAEHNSSMGWHCDADASPIGGEIDKDKYSEFTWGYAYSQDYEVSVTANGFGVTFFPSNAHGKSGSIVHRK